MKLLCAVLWISFALVVEVNCAQDSPCRLYTCKYSCDVVSGYMKLFFKDTYVDDVTFLSLRPINEENSSKDLFSHPSVCHCEAFLRNFRLSYEDLTTFEHETQDPATQHCFMMVKNDVEDGDADEEKRSWMADEDEDEDSYIRRPDGFFVILVLVVVAFVLWVILVVGVTWYAHSQRSAHYEDSGETEGLMVTDRIVPHCDVASSPKPLKNETNGNKQETTDNLGDSNLRDVAVITLYSSLPTVAGPRYII